MIERSDYAIYFEGMSKQYIQHELPTEILIYIFKRVRLPKELILSCTRIANLSKDPQVKAAWIIYQFGAAHCLFYAIKIRSSFLDATVAQAIIARGGILSRYFVHMFQMNFGAYDNKLIELKIAYGVGSSQLQKSQTIPWASDLPISVYIFLLKAASEIYQIKDLILSFKFIPLPPRSRDKLPENNSQEDIAPEEYPPKDGHENNLQLNVIARSFLFAKKSLICGKKSVIMKSVMT
ncbi:hypothetical protein C2G38_2297623 [Gigaspora rosea]|uniref:Uncharacterized protein n=1 Tax=Gigaspora rosea TaxID=44941 RepID=A0A397VHK8_9GLOM|nr:hypothetical protein C2G38_2297623 [Gigaspora rosea]